MRPHQGSVEGKENLPRPAGHTLLDAPQDPVAPDSVHCSVLTALFLVFTGGMSPRPLGHRQTGGTASVPM